MTSLEDEKARFLDRYNPCRTDAQAVLDALNSSSEHNSLYALGLSERERARVRETWKALLCELAQKYGRTVSESQYEKDIENIKKKMNEQFPNCFRNDRHPIYKYDPGFRISHAQKSLSVFLKHLWCIGGIATPPQCPVDAIILAKAGLRDRDTRWTYVNSIEEHRRKVAFLDECARASCLTLAEWELRAFQT